MWQNMGTLTGRNENSEEMGYYSGILFQFKVSKIRMIRVHNQYLPLQMDEGIKVSACYHMVDF